MSARAHTALGLSIVKPGSRGTGSAPAYQSLDTALTKHCLSRCTAHPHRMATAFILCEEAPEQENEGYAQAKRFAGKATSNPGTDSHSDTPEQTRDSSERQALWSAGLEARTLDSRV